MQNKIINKAAQMAKQLPTGKGRITRNNAVSQRLKAQQRSLTSGPIAVNNVLKKLGK